MKNNKIILGVITLVFSISLIFNNNSHSLNFDTASIENSNDIVMILQTELPFEN